MRFPRLKGFSSLRGRIFWSIIPIVLLLWSVGGALQLREHRQLVTEQLEKRGQSMAGNLAHSSELGVFVEDSQLLEASMRGAVADPDVAYVFIYAADGRVLAQAGDQVAQLPLASWKLPVEVKSLLAPAGQPISKRTPGEEEGVIDFLAPIVSEEVGTADELLIGAIGGARGQAQQREPRVIGAVRLGLSLRAVEDQMLALLRLWGGMLLAILTLSTLAIYMVSRRISQPVKRLTDQAKKIADGLLDQVIRVESRDEIGQLAENFNQMATALKGNIGEKDWALKELQQLNRTLEARVQERTAELEKASRHKSAFLANMSHELRTPMNAILGYTELILDNVYGEVSEKVQDVLERVDKNGRHLLALINDVLDLSKIEAGQLTLSLNDYSMKGSVHTVFTSLEPLAGGKSLSLRVTVPPDLPPGRGDERRISQVLLNLVGNAIKFTDVGEIRVEVAVSDDMFLVSVADTGPGIPESEQQHIFEEFHQADSSSTKDKGGTGLGLPITKRIIEMHGGRIWVESTLGKGSTFWVALPIRVEKQLELA